jgi:hypothetical protein
MHLDTRTVSAKTPRDGKLEITAAAASRLGGEGVEFALSAPAGEGRARLTEMECTCEKSAGARHLHHFIESPLLARLDPGTRVRIDFEDGRLSVRPG